MHSCEITIDNISKIEGSAGLKVVISNDKVESLKFIIQDYRRFYTQAVKNNPIVSVPASLSRICGTCSVAHLFAALKAIESSQEIEVTEQTKLLRRLAYDGLMIRDHALHLYFFVLPDILKIDSILDIPDESGNLGHILLHDSFDIKKLGADITNVVIGATIHAPYPTVGGFLKMPDPAKFLGLLPRLENIREQVIRGIEVFFNWDQVLLRDSDYLYLRNGNTFDFLEGEIMNSDGNAVNKEGFHKFLETVVIPYSESEGYKFSDTHKDYIVGSLARINYNKDLLNIRTKNDTEKYLSAFPSKNLHHNNLAQAIEILQCVNDAIDILKNISLINEKPVKKRFRAGLGVGVVEAPRGILYHMAKVSDKGLIENYEVVVPTSQNQISIENDLKQYFNDNLDKDEDVLRLEAEKIVRAYDPCMSCATNFLKIDWIRK